jgi:cysteine desulfurase
MGDAWRDPARGVYLDYNASSPLRPEVLDAMLPYLRSPGNASSIHRFGSNASEGIATARRQLAELLHCRPNELIVTSGATEANNLATHICAGTRMVTTAGEHPAVLEAVRARSRTGGEGPDVIAIDRNGSPDLEHLTALLETGDVSMVTVMLANNETGAITDLRPVIDAAHRAGALVHTDATQAVGRIPVHLDDLQVDLLSLSAHKFGGPQGVGALFVRRTSRIAQRPLLVGGGHEDGWRAGTSNVAGTVGMGAAAAVCADRLPQEQAQVATLRDHLEATLLEQVPTAWVNARSAPRLPGTASITFPGLPADALMTAMPRIAVSNGSACHAGAPSPSHVLLAMGLSREEADSTLGYATTGEEIDAAVSETVRAARELHDLLAPPPRSCGSPRHELAESTTASYIEGR